MSCTRAHANNWLLLLFTACAVAALMLPRWELALLRIFTLVITSFHIHYGVCVVRRILVKLMNLFRYGNFVPTSRYMLWTLHIFKRKTNILCHAKSCEFDLDIYRIYIFYSLLPNHSGSLNNNKDLF